MHGCEYGRKASVSPSVRSLTPPVENRPIQQACIDAKLWTKSFELAAHSLPDAYSHTITITPAEALVPCMLLCGHVNEVTSIACASSTLEGDDVPSVATVSDDG